VIDRARYVVAFAEKALAAFGGSAGLAARVTEFLAREEYKVRRDVDGIGKWVNVRGFVQALALGGDSAQASLEEAGLVGVLVPLEVELSIAQNGTAKVAEVVEALFGEKGVPHHAVRVALLGGANSPLELLAFRKAPAPVRTKTVEPIVSDVN
jgi:hypothetical protein